MKKYLGELKQHPEALFVLGYMLFPLLALVVAALGLFMVLGGHKIFGLVLLLVPAQIFIFSAVWAINNRKRLLEEK
ncbi:NF038396 family protein [Glutamicibacter halophytocola]|uniref:NF038396 family protein n=1 Tax=Glutamicibacter halophytocola TaxID=1933880 RepID=A0AA95BQ98_9MICC|nr:NF038396 family protein [Glutamicibacter halophytocola]UUX58034.1 NF038396 family protein [Glutamicibacter halophytocola]